MIQIETLMAVAGALLLVSVFANRISVFLGIPGLLIFIGIGMLAGSDGIVRIQFYDARMTNYIGTVALAFILFAGGLDTRWRDVRPVLAGGSLLATLGVVLTALFLFLPAYYVLRLELPVALLLGVIVSSTDAPAVFMIMRTQKAELRDNLRPLLEFESAGNDPMAVLLSLGALAWLQNSDFAAAGLAKMFVLQLVVGFAAGCGLGWLAGVLLKKICICYFGLYTVFGVGFVLLTFGVAQLLGGSGFLAVYVAGIIIGNRPFTYRRNLIRFHDSLAWIAQVGMFLLLGLLVNPPRTAVGDADGAAGRLFPHFLFPAGGGFHLSVAQPLRVEGKAVCRLGGAERGGADHSCHLSADDRFSRFPVSVQPDFLSCHRFGAFAGQNASLAGCPAGSLPEMKKRSAARTERQTFRR